MRLFKKEKGSAFSVQTRPGKNDTLPLYGGERALYKALREMVPIIDASVYKLKRLLGGFHIECDNERLETAFAEFFNTVRVNGLSSGVGEFIGTYFEDLITYGNAVGEIVLSGGQIAALYNAALDDVEIEEAGPLGIRISAVRAGQKIPCAYPELILVSALNPNAGSIQGNSLLKGLPFVSEILMKIYQSIGLNWERAGNVRFAVTCKSDGGAALAHERAAQMAEQWKKAMHSREISDFVAVGDVSIKAIGADNQILQSDVPVRQMLEQIVAKMGVPPFLLGLSWSSTERMSSQQADILTSELEAYRGLLNPVIAKICKYWLALQGLDSPFAIAWDDITMQDEVDHANAQYMAARTEALKTEAEKKEEALG